MARVPVLIRSGTIAEFMSSRLSRRTPPPAFGLPTERGVLTSRGRNVRLESGCRIERNIQRLSWKLDLFDVGDVFVTEPFDVVFEPFGRNDVLLESSHVRCQFDVQGKRSTEFYHRRGGGRKRRFYLRNGNRNGCRSLPLGRNLPGRRRFGNLRRMFEFGGFFDVRRLPKRFRQFRNERRSLRMSQSRKPETDFLPNPQRLDGNLEIFGALRRDGFFHDPEVQHYQSRFGTGVRYRRRRGEQSLLDGRKRMFFGKRERLFGGRKFELLHPRIRQG